MTKGGNEMQATHFAITTVNVPDRLDLRDMDDRKQGEEYSRHRGFDSAAFRAWGPRLLLGSVLAIIAFVVFEGIDTWRTALSAPQLSTRLTNALGVPVTVGSSQFAISPSPQLVLSQVSIDKKLTLDRVSIGVSTKQFGQAFQGHGWNWGEAVVTTSPLTLDQGRVLLNLIPKFDAAIPKSLSSVHFEHLRVSDQPLLDGDWDVTVNRRSSDNIATAVATQHRNKGSLSVELSPTTDSEVVAFQVDGSNWLLPFGPRFPLEEVVASGQASSTRIEISQFSLGGAFGAAKGQITGQWDRIWLLNGSLQAEGIDLDALIRLVAGAPEKDKGEPDAPTVIQGTASFVGVIEGHGQTLAEAIGAAFLEAPVHVRTPVLTGINLGYAATRPTEAGVTSGGSTRFVSLDTIIQTMPDKVLFRDIRAHSGALAAYGQVELMPDHSLTGLLHVDLGQTRVLAPIRVAVRGTVLRPEFGR